MIDRQHIGRIVSRHRVEVERGRLRAFAAAIGETDARWTGAERLPVPPTFLFCLEMERPDPYDWFQEVGLDLPKVLHGEQSFVYHRTCHAGDVLDFESQIEDVYERKGGALEFLVKRTRVADRHGNPIADLRSVIVQRHG